MDKMINFVMEYCRTPLSEEDYSSYIHPLVFIAYDEDLHILKMKAKDVATALYIHSRFGNLLIEALEQFTHHEENIQCLYPSSTPKINNRFEVSRLDDISSPSASSVGESSSSTVKIIESMCADIKDLKRRITALEAN